MTAICVRCGSYKRSWAWKCPSCGLDPKSDVELGAKSYILSTERYDDGSAPEERMSLPNFEEDDLRQIGERIREGEPYEFSSKDVALVVDALEPKGNLHPSGCLVCLNVVYLLIRIFLPIIIFLAAILGLGLLLWYSR